MSFTETLQGLTGKPLADCPDVRCAFFHAKLSFPFA